MSSVSRQSVIMRHCGQSAQCAGARSNGCNQIIFDGIMTFCEVDFGNEVRENLDWIYEYRKEKSGIVTSLDAQGPARPRRKPEESQTDEQYARQFLGDEVFERVYKPQEKSRQPGSRRRPKSRPTVEKKRAKPTTKKPKR